MQTARAKRQIFLLISYATGKEAQLFKEKGSREQKSCHWPHPNSSGCVHQGKRCDAMQASAVTWMTWLRVESCWKKLLKWLQTIHYICAVSTITQAVVCPVLLVIPSVSSDLGRSQRFSSSHQVKKRKLPSFFQISISFFFFF